MIGSDDLTTSVVVRIWQDDSSFVCSASLYANADSLHYERPKFILDSHVKSAPHDRNYIHPKLSPFRSILLGYVFVPSPSEISNRMLNALVSFSIHVPCPCFSAPILFTLSSVLLPLFSKEFTIYHLSSIAAAFCFPLNTFVGVTLLPVVLSVAALMLAPSV